MDELIYIGEMHAIPANAAGLIVRVDRLLTEAQAEQIEARVKAKLGSEIKVLVIGPELTVTATE